MWAARSYQVQALPFPLLQHPPQAELTLGEVAQYDDELFAYLIFQHLRGHGSLRERETLIGYERRGDRLVYSIYVVYGGGLRAAIDSLVSLEREFLFLTAQWCSTTGRRASELRWQTSNLISAYNHPTYRTLEKLSQKEVLAYTASFVRYKSQTDPRVRRQLKGAPEVLSSEEARQLSRDILVIANFFEVPLEFFLGIGAMENNFMNVSGDLDHAIWKPRAQAGDIVLRRRKGRVLVLNQASGVWQITRETLRWAHRLHLADERDYAKLPAHLRPEPKLDFETFDPRVLTTYAGLLFRHLLDRFDGDVAKAVGAYNGGPGKPNARYEAGVSEVAAQARRIMEQAAGLRGIRVAEMRFLSSTPRGAQ